MAGATPTVSDLKITAVEAIYLRCRVETQYDSGQDALTGQGEHQCGDHRLWRGRFQPDRGEGCIEGAVFAHDGDRAGTRRHW